MGKIKFFDIYNQDKIIHFKAINKIKKTFKNNDFILGKEVKLFESRFSKFCSSKYSISCGNGTDALFLALKSLDLPQNSEVIVPAMTWVSTISSIIHCGYKPILVDVEKDTSLISINEIKKKINSKTKAIIPVHLYGNVCMIDKIKKLIKNKKIFIIEDAAQAHGAKHNNNKKIGFYSDLTCYSFYPGKNLGCYGDGGMVTTNSIKLRNKLNKLRNLGSIKKGSHEYIGINSRLDTIQANILNLKLNNVNYLNYRRKKIAHIYNKKIINSSIIKIKYCKNSVYHQYVIIVKNRPKLTKLLTKNNIEFGIHYTFSINKLKCFRKFFNKKTYPNAEFISKKCLSLPIDPYLKYRDQLKICNLLNRFN